MRRILAWWALLAGLYLLLADTVVAPELVAGAVAATIATVGAALVHRERRPLKLRRRWLPGAARAMFGIVGDLVPLARALVARGILRRDGEGTLIELPFTATGDGPEEAAYRALTEALGSLGPNTIVVDVDRRRGVLIAHQLLPTADAAARAAPLPR
jgi:multisubunit Na+/H+ antiporter MnhE subunit